MQTVGHQLIHSWYSVETEMLKLFKNEASNIILWLKTVAQTVHCYPMTVILSLEKQMIFRLVARETGNSSTIRFTDLVIKEG